jgi:hypothetical protein
VENLTKRRVHNPRFVVHFLPSGRMETSTKVKKINLTGEDARKVLDPGSDLLDGVIFHRKIPQSNARAEEILIKLCEKHMPPLKKKKFTLLECDISIESLSMLDVAEIMFASHKQIVDFCRDRTKTRQHAHEFQAMIEKYFQCNILLFKPSDAITTYKAKHLVMLEILKSGHIRSLFDHLCEGGEATNSNVNRQFNRNTTRDGGKLGNFQSEFHDIHASYLAAIKMTIARTAASGDTTLPKVLDFLKDENLHKIPVAGPQRPTMPKLTRIPSQVISISGQIFHAISNEILPPIRLDVGKTTPGKTYNLHAFQ